MAELGLNDTNDTPTPVVTRNKNTAAAQQARFGATAVLYTIVIIAVLVMVNWLANRYNKTYDTTSNKRSTLSQETQKMAQNLKSDATTTYIAKLTGFQGTRGLLRRKRY